MPIVPTVAGSGVTFPKNADPAAAAPRAERTADLIRMPAANSRAS